MYLELLCDKLYRFEIFIVPPKKMEYEKIYVIFAVLVLMISVFADSAADYCKAAEQGHSQAQYNLGLCYANGCGVAKNPSEAVKWYRKAAQQGVQEAKVKLSDLGDSR